MEALGLAQAPRWLSQLDGWRGECRPKATWAREPCRPSPAGWGPAGLTTLLPALPTSNKVGRPSLAHPGS